MPTRDDIDESTGYWDDPYEEPQAQRTDPEADRIRGYYEQYLGRPGSDVEWRNWYNFPDAEGKIASSKEARNRLAALTAAPTPPAAPESSPAPITQQPFQREQFRDAWMSTGMDINRQNALLAQYGLQPSANGTVTLPTGEQIDLRIGAKAGLNQAGWTGVAGGGQKYGQAAGYGGESASGVPSAGRGDGGNAGTRSVSQAASAVGAPGSTVIDPEVRQALLDLMARSRPGDINVATDPNLSPQARAYAAARQRSANQERRQLAERAAFEGLNLGGAGSGSFTTNLAGITENAGRDVAGYEAGLVGEEVKARRADLLSALQIATSIGARDQEAQIRLQLAQLDEAFRRAQLAQQGSQFGQQLGFERSRWDDQYGLNRAELEATMNRNAVLAALGR